MFGVHQTVLVAETGRVDDLNRRGIVFVIGAAPIWQPLGGGQYLATDQKGAQAASPSMVGIG